jgi:hypothetical protein
MRTAIQNKHAGRDADDSQPNHLSRRGDSVHDPESRGRRVAFRRGKFTRAVVNALLVFFGVEAAWGSAPGGLTRSARRNPTRETASDLRR